jgi:CMP-N-acetylneuraminic acid synthetase
VCLIPARGGSVRLPRKNIRMFHGKPIIAYSIENARKSGLFDAVVVSTDDDEIANIAAEYGAHYVRRPKDDGTQGTQELAGDYLRERPEIGICCVLYPCAPLINWAHLVEGWRTLQTEPGCLFAPSTDAQGNDAGCFYWGFAQAFRESWSLDGWGEPVVLQPGRCCDINTEDDWKRAERMYELL